MGNEKNETGHFLLGLAIIAVEVLATVGFAALGWWMFR
jgi:hypothetical protein